MKTSHLLNVALVLGITVFVSCSENKTDSGEKSKVKLTAQDSITKVINELEGKVNMLDESFDRTSAKQLLSAYQNYYNQNYKDSIAGIYLYKAARLAQGLKNFKQAISLFTNYHDGFPNHPNRPQAALIVGVIYEQDLHDKANAKSAYQRVIEIHPESQEAKDASSLISYLDMSDEDLIKMLKEKNK
ncbi:MAG: tetratricopeptide repeat protein [Flavobacteriales bacterium]|nr:tetratricopeptide repeat protein [Flavobacteriales bacterium]